MRSLCRRAIILLAVYLILCSGIFAQTQLQVGYTTLIPDAGSPAPVGAALFSYTNPDGVLVTQAGVGASGLIQFGRIFVDEAGPRTAIALVNPSNQDASTTFTLRDAAGTVIDSRSEKILAHQHTALYVSDLFPNTSTNLTGSLTYNSSQPLAAIALRESRNAQSEPLYTTLPVLDLNAPPGNGTAVFPQIAVGGGFTTQILLLNGTSGAMHGRIDFVGPDGEPLSVGQGQNTIVNLRYDILANGAYLAELGGTDMVNAGYAVVTPDPGSSTPSGTIVFRLFSGADLVTEAGVAASGATTAARIFVDYIGTQTGVALANPTDTPANVTLTLLDRFGFPQTSIQQVLPPRNHSAKFVHEMFSISDGYTGLLEVRSDIPVVSVALKLTVNGRNQLVLTTLPIADLNRPPGNGLIVFPHIAIGGGFSTRLILINTSTTGVSAGQLTFYKDAGTPFVVPMTGQTGSQFRYSVVQGGGRQLYPGNSATLTAISLLDPSSNQPTSELVINEGNTIRARLQMVDNTGARRDDFDPAIVSLDTSVAAIVDPSGSIRGIKAGFSTLAVTVGGAVTNLPATVVKVDAGATGFATTGIAQDAAQRLYLSSSTANVVLRADDLKQTPQPYAGVSGTAGLKDDLRSRSLFNRPSFLALNQADGNLYLSDAGNNVIRRIRSGPSGRVETLAGGFNNPQGVALDARGNLWVADSGSHTIRRINLLTGNVETIAGLAGTPGSTDGTGTQARFNSPFGIAVEGESAAQELQRNLRGQPPPPISVIVADSGNGLIRRVKETGEVSTIQTSSSSSLSTARLQKRSVSRAIFSSPAGVAIDPVGNIYVAEPGYGRVSVILQTGEIVAAAQSGTFDSPQAIGIVENGKVVVTGTGNAARQLVYGQPQITAVSPAEFSSKGGEHVTVKGSNFAPDTLIVIGGTVIANQAVVNTQTVTFTTPALASGRATLTASNRGGASQTVVTVDAIPLNQLPAGYITTVAGGSTYAGEGSLATASAMAPVSVAVDVNGNAFIFDGLNAKVRRVDSRTGILTTVAGNGTGISSGDNGLAVAAGISAYATGVTFDPAGNLLIADAGIRRIDAKTGIITTIVGGEYGFCGDGGDALSACFDGINGFVSDADGNLFIADRFNHRVRRVDAKTNIITTFAGNGPAAFSGDNGFASAASLDEPFGVAVDDARRLLYIADSGNSRVRKVDLTSGIITTFAGGGDIDIGDGGPATSGTVFPNAVVLDAAGNVLISDRGHSLIRKVDINSGIITTVAGSGVIGSGGDGGLAAQASLSDPFGIAIDGSGNLLIADFYRYVVRKVDGATQIISTFAGNRRDENDEDGIPGTSATLQIPTSVTIDGAGNLFVASNFRIRRLDAATGNIYVIAGGGRPEYGVGDGGPATSAEISPGFGRVAIDGQGNLYIADRYGYRVRKVQAGTNIITTIAGTGENQSYGEGVPATAAGVLPDSVALDQRGYLYIAESDNPEGHYVIRRMDLSTGLITTIAGGGTAPFGENGPAIAAKLGAKFRFVVDAAGNIYIADDGKIRRVDAVTQIIRTVAGNDSADTYIDNQPAASVRLAPVAVDIDSAGNVYLLDYSYPSAIRKVDAGTGIIHTLITFFGMDDGSGGIGDNGPASAAIVHYPEDLTIDPQGNIFIADTENSRIRAIRGPLP